MSFSAWTLVAFVMAAGDATTLPSQSPLPPVAADTLVSIEIAEPLTTRTLKPGDMFAIRLAEPILSDGAVVVPAGAPGLGQVVDSGRAGFGGKPAKLVLAARYIEWDGRRVSLRAFRWAQAGADRQTAAGLLLAVPYAGLASIFIQGGEIDVPAGVRAQAKLAQSLSQDPPPASTGAKTDLSSSTSFTPPSK